MRLMQILARAEHSGTEAFFVRLTLTLHRNALAREGFATYQQHFAEATVAANYHTFFEKITR